MQAAEEMLRTIYIDVVYTKLGITQAISSTSSSITSLSNKGGTSIVLTTTPGCGRDSKGNLRLDFVINHADIVEEEGGVEARRKLQSTPCSGTDGTTVGVYAHAPPSGAGNPCTVLFCSKPVRAMQVITIDLSSKWLGEPLICPRLPITHTYRHGLFIVST